MESASQTADDFSHAIMGPFMSPSFCIQEIGNRYIVITESRRLDLLFHACKDGARFSSA